MGKTMKSQAKKGSVSTKKGVRKKTKIRRSHFLISSLKNFAIFLPLQVTQQKTVISETFLLPL